MDNGRSQANRVLCKKDELLVWSLRSSVSFFSVRRRNYPISLESSHCPPPHWAVSFYGHSSTTHCRRARSQAPVPLPSCPGRHGGGATSRAGDPDGARRVRADSDCRAEPTGRANHFRDQVAVTSRRGTIRGQRFQPTAGHGIRGWTKVLRIAVAFIFTLKKYITLAVFT